MGAVDTFFMGASKCKKEVGLGKSMWEERYITHCLQLLGTKINPHLSQLQFHRVVHRMLDNSAWLRSRRGQPSGKQEVKKSGWRYADVFLSHFARNSQRQLGMLIGFRFEIPTPFARCRAQNPKRAAQCGLIRRFSGVKRSQSKEPNKQVRTATLEELYA